MVSQFVANLKKLPSVENLKLLEIIRSDNGDVLASIENKPGKSGSLAVYHFLFKTYGVLSTKAAKHGVELFGEYAAEAKLIPGSHPNIDFLFKLISSGEECAIKITEKGD